MVLFTVKAKVMIYRIILFLFLTIGMSHADVQSTSGNIDFDVNNDGSVELRIAQDGLGIGTTSPSTNLHVLGNTVISESITVGALAGNSSLELNGTIGFNLETVSANTTLSGNTNVLVDTSVQGNVNIRLPSSGVDGRVYNIKKTSSDNTVRVIATIDDGELLYLHAGSSPFSSVSLVHNESQWWILSSLGNVETVNIASANLVLHYKLDDTMGTTAIDSSGNATPSNGTLDNGFTFTSNSTIGKIGTALDFDVNDHISSDFQMPSGNVGTIMCWAKPGLVSGFRMPVGENDARPGITFNNDDIFWYWQTSGGGPLLQTLNVLSVGTWIHLAMTCNGTNATMYVNGSQVGTSGSASDTNFGPFYVGFDTWDYEGVIDDVRVYNVDLTADQIQTIYSLGE